MLSRNIRVPTVAYRCVATKATSLQCLRLRTVQPSLPHRTALSCSATFLVQSRRSISWFGGGKAAAAVAPGDAAAAQATAAALKEFEVQATATPAVTAGAVSRVGGPGSSSSSAEYISATASPSSINTGTEGSTIFHAIDGYWTSFWSSFGFNGGSLIDSGVSWLAVAVDLTGVPWWAVSMGLGFALRFFTLGFSIYGERAALRMQLAMPELRQTYDKFQAVYYDSKASTKEITRVGNQLAEEKREVYKKYGTSNVKSFASVFGSPFLLYGFTVIMRATSNVPAIEKSSFLWMTSLATADPSVALPATALLLTGINIELLFRAKKYNDETQTGGITLYLPWIARIGLICVFPVVCQFRAAVVLYMLGASIAGLGQPIAMMSDRFRGLIGAPLKGEVEAALKRAAKPVAGAGTGAKGGKGSSGGGCPIPGVGGSKPPSAAAGATPAGDSVDPASLRLGVTLPRITSLFNLQKLMQWQEDSDNYNKQQNDLAQRKGSWKSDRR